VIIGSGRQLEFRHQGQDFALPVRQVVERDAGASADEDGDDGRVDDRAALGDPADRVGEVVEVRDPVLEHVADPAGSVAHQTQRERRLDMLREDEDPDGCPMLRADRLRVAGEVCSPAVLRPEALSKRTGPGLCRSDGQQIVEIGGETGAFGRRMLRVPGLRSDWVGLR
jgi:hypothetical protein